MDIFLFYLKSTSFFKQPQYLPEITFKNQAMSLLQGCMKSFSEAQIYKIFWGRALDSRFAGGLPLSSPPPQLRLRGGPFSLFAGGSKLYLDTTELWGATEMPTKTVTFSKLYPSTHSGGNPTHCLYPPNQTSRATRAIYKEGLKLFN